MSSFFIEISYDNFFFNNTNVGWDLKKLCDKSLFIIAKHFI